MLEVAYLDGVARRALASAGRPADGDPVCIADALNFALLPCAAGTRHELERTTCDRLVFACEPGIAAHAARVRLALARGLLLREGVPHHPDDVAALARRLGTFPE